MAQETVLTPCRVPWSISPSGSGLCLKHTETDIAPECSVTFGANRLTADGTLAGGEVEIVFDGCYFARVSPKSDVSDIDECGFRIENGKAETLEGDIVWPPREWVEKGVCPDSGFYFATESAWMESVPLLFRRDCRHFVLAGRDGYLELIAREYKWRELSGSWHGES